MFATQGKVARLFELVTEHSESIISKSCKPETNSSRNNAWATITSALNRDFVEAELNRNKSQNIDRNLNPSQNKQTGQEMLYFYSLFKIYFIRNTECLEKAPQ